MGDAKSKENKENKGWSEAESWLSELVEQSRANTKRWFIAWVVTLAALIVTNAYWIHQFTSYEYVSQDGTGVNSINTGNQENVDLGTEDEN